jgi:SNF2 family DNA or RNA helicase
MQAFQTSSKLQAAISSLKETLAKNPQAKALVYSNFVDAGLTPYGAALEHEKIPYGQFHGSMTDEERKQALDDYNSGKSRVLLLGPAAAEGISAKGTQLIQLLDPHWNEARMGQARGRGLRFDSHEGLPEELRNVKIQRFVAKMPPPGWLGSLFGEKPRPSADEILERESARKEALNEQFREVLRRVGSPGYQRPWHLFG